MKSSSSNDNSNHVSLNIKQYEKELSNLENQNFNLKLQLYHSNVSNRNPYVNSLNQGTTTSMESNQYPNETSDSNVKFCSQSENGNIPLLHQNTNNSLIHEQYDYCLVTKNSVGSTTGHKYISPPSYPSSNKLKSPTYKSPFTTNDVSDSKTNIPTDAVISFNTTSLYSPPFHSISNNNNNSSSNTNTATSPTSAALRSSSALFSSSSQNNVTPKPAAVTTADIIKQKDMEILQSLQDQLNDTQQKYKQSQNVVEYCMQQINTFKTEIQNYATQITEKDEVIKKLRESNHQLTYELESYKTVNRNHSATYQELLHQKTNLETSLVHLHSKQESHFQENTRLKTQCNDLMKINQMLTDKCDFVEARVKALSSQQAQTRRVDMQNIRQELLHKLETMSVAAAVSRMKQEQTLEVNDILQCILDVTTDATTSRNDTNNTSNSHNNSYSFSLSPSVINDSGNYHTHVPPPHAQSNGAAVTSSSSLPVPGGGGGSVSQEQFQSAIEYYK